MMILTQPSLSFLHDVLFTISFMEVTPKRKIRDIRTVNICCFYLKYHTKIAIINVTHINEYDYQISMLIHTHNNCNINSFPSWLKKYGFICTFTRNHFLWAIILRLNFLICDNYQKYCEWICRPGIVYLNC